MAHKNRKRAGFYWTIEEKKRFKSLAEQRGISMQKLFIVMINEWLDAQPKK
jgi:hypothetical protein